MEVKENGDCIAFFLHLDKINNDKGTDINSIALKNQKKLLSKFICSPGKLAVKSNSYGIWKRSSQEKTLSTNNENKA